MCRAVFYLVAAANLCGQGPGDLFHKAPRAVDEALRARVAKFYQLEVEGKFRQAEALVADDTKDYFYASQKPKYLGLEINRITYSDDFPKADVLLTTKRIVMMPGFADKPVPMPQPSKWKLVNGEWYWYLSEDDLYGTPFGNMKPSGSGAGTGAADTGKAAVRPTER